MRTAQQIVCLILGLIIWQGSAVAQSSGENTQRLNLAVGFRLGLLMDPNLAESFELTKKKIIEYGIDEVRIYGGNAITYKYLDIEGFPEVKQTGNAEELELFRRGLRWFEDNNVRVTLSGGEPSLPGISYYPDGKTQSFFDLYPEAKYLDSGILWKFYEERTYAIFKKFPEVDATDFFLWETPILDDLNYFTGIKWQKSLAWHKGTNQYYSHADYLTEFMSAVTRGANRAGKDFSIMTFSHYPHQERLLLESLTEIEKRKVPLRMVHKSQPGDWDPYKGPNNIMMQTNGPASMLFDGLGEYWGRGLIPYCFPEEIQSRLQHALKHNQNIHTLAMRTFWENDQKLFDHYNEINLFSLSRSAEKPDADVEQIWLDWASGRFGEKAAPKVIEALKRTDDIGKLVYYYRGIWVQEHSQMANLDYMTAQVLHTGRAMLEWSPENKEDNALIEAFMYRPTEEIIESAVRDRKKAIALSEASVADVNSVKDELATAEYERLIFELELQKQFSQLSELHIETYLRYIIQRDNPNTKNGELLEERLVAMENMAASIDKIYGYDNFIVSGGRIRKFIGDIRAGL